MNMKETETGAEFSLLRRTASAHKLALIYDLSETFIRRLGLRKIKLGRRCTRYFIEDVEAHLAKRVVAPRRKSPVKTSTKEVRHEDLLA